MKNKPVIIFYQQGANENHLRVGNAHVCLERAVGFCLLNDFEFLFPQLSGGFGQVFPDIERIQYHTEKNVFSTMLFNQ